MEVSLKGMIRFVQLYGNYSIDNAVLELYHISRHMMTGRFTSSDANVGQWV